MTSCALQRIKNEINSYTFDKISKLYFEHFAKKLPVAEIQILLQEYTSNIHARLAISLLMIDQGFEGARPYLTVHDELLSMGANNASLDFLYKFQRINPWHPLVIGRLITRLHASKDFSAIISLLDYLPFRQQESVLNVNSVRKILIDISKFMLCDTILLKFGGFTEEIRWINEQRADMAQYSLQDIPSLIAAENHGLAQKLISYFYSAGVRTQEFFKLASSPMKSELDINSRVIFFRIEAEKHCTDAKISELAAKSYLHIGEVEKALHVLRRAILKRCCSEQIIYLFTRVLTLLGRPLDELFMAGFFGMPDYAKVSDFIKKSSYNQGINNGGFVEAEFTNNGLSHSQSKLWCSSVPVPMITCSYNRNRVALCLSGQIRGFDENYKNILRVIKEIKNCDVFIDTWAKGRLTPPRFNRVHRFLGVDLCNRLPEVAKMPGGFRDLFPETTKAITQSMEIEINSEYLSQYLPNAVVNVEDESNFEKWMERDYNGLRCLGSFNQAKMFYKIYQANQLVTRSDQYNDYDVVIRCRPDLNIIIDDLNSYVKDVSTDRNLIYTSYVTSAGYGDQFAIGSTDAMNIYSSLWTRAISAGRLSYSEVFNEDANLAGEALLANHLILNGISVKGLKPKVHEFTNSLAVNVVDIEDALIKDIIHNGLHDEMKEFISHFNACRANKIRFK